MLLRFITTVTAVWVFNVGVGSLLEQEFDGLYWEPVVDGLVQWSKFSGAAEVDVSASHQELFHPLQVGWLPLEIDREDIVARFFIL
jgi:hypothetical protein